MPNKSFVEDMLTLGTGVLNNLSDVRQELKAQVKQQAESVIKNLDLVTRDDFDAAFAMLSKARVEQESLSKRLARLEAHLGMSSAKVTVKKKKTNLPSVKTLKKGKKKK